MKVIVLPRGQGKTKRLLELAQKDFLYIVCINKQEVQRLWGIIVEQKLNIPQPITWYEFIDRHYSGIGTKGFLIDNLDLCIQSMTPVKIHAVSLTEDE